jgi:hypothetical protein
MNSQNIENEAHKAILLTYVLAHNRDIKWHLSANKFLREYNGLEWVIDNKVREIKRLDKIRLKLIKDNKELKKEIAKLKRKLRNESS